MSLDPAEAAKLLTAPARSLDLVRITGDVNKISVNAVTGGFSGKVAAEVTGELKQSWGPLAYLRGAVGTLTDPPVYHLTLRFDGGRERTIDALNVVVANARTAAGGFVVAPTANPEDGKFDIVLVRAAHTLDLSIIAAHLMEGDYTHDPNVLHRRARRLELHSSPPLPISIDGERTEGSRFTFEIRPKAVRVVPGPGYKGGRKPPLRARLFGVTAAALRLLVRTPLTILVGFLLALASAGLFGWLAHSVLAGQWVEWNEAVRQSVIARNDPTADTVAWAFSRVGDVWTSIVVCLLITAVFARRGQYLNAATTAALLFGGLLLEGALKWAFRVDRPAAADRLDVVSWYSFPSGHALHGSALYLGLAALLAYSGRLGGWRWGVAGLLVLLSAGICWSRVQLRVHWVTDVVGGALAAVCWVTACLLARHYARNRRTTL